MKKLIPLVALLFLPGCVAVWGSSYNIESQSNSDIELKFDTNFTDLDHIQKIAQDHCQQYGKDAVIQSQQKSIWHLTTVSYSCVSRPQAN